MDEKIKVLMVVWRWLDFNFWWLEKMVKSGEISESQAGWMIWESRKNG
jgi:hypothetical protein